MLRIIFAATPELACPSLEALQQLAKLGQIEICAVLTQADQPAGRKRVLQASAIKVKALELGFDQAAILTPAKLNLELRQRVAELRPDLLVVFAYGKIFRQKFLDLFPLGGVNLHPSALPQWRGPSPIEAQLLNGSEQLSISLQRMSLEMDAGDILEQQSFRLPAQANYFDAAQIASQQGAAMLRQCCQNIVALGHAYLDTAKPQDSERASYCQLICKEDGRLEWHRSALQLSRQCRAYAAWPKAHTWLDWPKSPRQQINILCATEWQPEGDTAADEHRLLEEFASSSRAQPGALLAIHPKDGLLVLTGKGVLAIQQLQRQNRNICSAKDFANQLQGLSPNLGQENQKILAKWGQMESLSREHQLCCYHFEATPAV